MLELAMPPKCNLSTFYNSESPYRVERLIKDYSSDNVNYVYYLDKSEDIFSQLNKLNTLSSKDLKITIDNQIANEINAYGYGITNIEESMFEDFDKEFKIYTVELKNEIEDYDKLLQIEKTIKEKLNLYSKGIMLEIV